MRLLYGGWGYKSLQSVTYNLIGSPGHSLVPHNIGEATLGTVSPYRTRAADVGDAKCNETDFGVNDNQN